MSELPQAFCRTAVRLYTLACDAFVGPSPCALRSQAVAGATYVLRRGIDALLLEPDGGDGAARRVCGVRTAAGQTLRCHALAASTAFWHGLRPPCETPTRYVCRAAALTDAPLPVGASADASQLVAVLPVDSLPGGGPTSPVRLLQYGPPSCVTPEGRHLLHLSTPAADAAAAGEGAGAAQRALWPALTALLDVGNADAGGDAAASHASAASCAGDAAPPKPRLRWAVFYTAALDEVRASARVLSFWHAVRSRGARVPRALQPADATAAWLPANGALCVGPGPEADVCSAVRAASAAFARLFPDLPFFAPPAEDAAAGAAAGGSDDDEADAALLTAAARLD